MREAALVKINDNKVLVIYNSSDDPVEKVRKHYTQKGIPVKSVDEYVHVFTGTIKTLVLKSYDRKPEVIVEEVS